MKRRELRELVAAGIGGVVGFLLPTWAVVVIVIGGIMWYLKTMEPR